MDLTKMSVPCLLAMCDECNYPGITDELARRLAAAEAQLAVAREGLEYLRPRVLYYDSEQRGQKINRAPGWNGMTQYIDDTLAKLEQP